ncbi:MAG: di-trans,poly-cis-decaprenylcistransferase [Lentisphaerae bacterium]|nr:di-trans,poly-cis-decaprenylcistransferase [Lentisphaerota bacterium]
MSAPRHVAVIMDGNGRWAKAKGLPRLMGHRAGADALDRVMHYCRDAGVEFLTVYAFSTENWKRSTEEVSGLMKLLSSFIHKKEKELVGNGIRFRVIGRRTDLSEKLQKEIAALEKKTAGGSFTLVVALSYGGRDEILRAAAKFQGGTEEDFSALLDTAGIPDPDLIVRTSGELRLSNFLLWQAAYAEFYFTDVLWPDFGREEFDKALASFAKRERRMGGRK